jgi:hypothetical protein
VLAAALFAAFEVRPSLSTFEAAFAAAGVVVSRGALDCVSALAAALFTALLVEVRSAFDAAFAALGLVPFFIHVLLVKTFCSDTFIASPRVAVGARLSIQYFSVREADGIARRQ